MVDTSGGSFRLEDILCRTVLSNNNGKSGIYWIGRRLNPHGEVIEKNLQREAALAQRFLINGGGDQTGLKHWYLLFHQVVGDNSDLSLSDCFADGMAGTVVTGIYQIDNADIRMTGNNFPDNIITVKLVTVKKCIFYNFHMRVMGGKFFTKAGYAIFKTGKVSDF